MAKAAKGNRAKGGGRPDSHGLEYVWSSIFSGGIVVNGFNNRAAFSAVMSQKSFKLILYPKTEGQLEERIFEIDGHRIEIVTSEFNSCNILRMTVGTNCPRGGDAGHGGRTVIILADASGTEMRCTQRPGTVELVFRGDTECETLIDALEFASKTLRKMQADNQRGV